MKKLLIALLIAAVLAPSAFAQQRTNIVVADCGTLSLGNGNPAYTYVDRTGRLCSTGTTGGASETTLGSVLTELQSILTKLNSTLTVSAASLPLPTGAASESTLSTLNGKVTAVNTGAVTVSSALPAGTNAIGKLAANSGVDIGDVDVTSVPADPFGANADAAATAGGTGSIQAKLRRATTDIDRAAAALETIRDSTAAVPVYGGPCQDPLNTRTSFNVRITSTTFAELVPATSAKTGYICSIKLVVDASDRFSIIDGTTTTTKCDGGTPIALDGNTTASSGPLYTAGGGFAFGNGVAWLYKGTGTNRTICGIIAGSGPVTVSGSYVVQ